MSFNSLRRTLVERNMRKEGLRIFTGLTSKRISAGLTANRIAGRGEGIKLERRFISAKLRIAAFWMGSK